MIAAGKSKVVTFFLVPPSPFRSNRTTKAWLLGFFLLLSLYRALMILAFCDIVASFLEMRIFVGFDRSL